MARLIFKPFMLISSIVAGKLAGRLFDRIWSALDRKGDGTVHSATEKETPVARAVAGNMVQAATFAGTQAVVSRASVRAIHHFTGFWVGDKPPKSEEPVEASNSSI
jgi:hypothetical protein